jgi:hypothetical protein
VEGFIDFQAIVGVFELSSAPTTVATAKASCLNVLHHKRDCMKSFCENCRCEKIEVCRCDKSGSKSPEESSIDKCLGWWNDSFGMSDRKSHKEPT